MVFDPSINTSELRPASSRNSNGTHLTSKPSSASEDGDDLSLQQVLTVLRRRAVVLSSVTIAGVIASSALILSRPPEYTGTFRLLVEPVTAGSRLADSLTSDTLQTLSPLKGLGKADGLDYISQIEVLKSETLLEPTIQRIQARYSDIDYETLMKRLKINRPKDSKVLDFTYASRDPEEIKFVLAELSKAYLSYSVIDRKTNLNRGVEFVDAQIKTQRNEVSRVERQLEQFRRKNSVVDPKELTGALSEQLRDIAKTQAENRVKLAAAKTLYTNLQQQVSQTPAQAVSLATLSESPTYQGLLTKLREVDTRLAVESARFRKGPLLESLQAQRQKLLPLIQDEAQRVLGKTINLEDSAKIEFQGTVARALIQQFVEAANQVQVLQTQNQGVDQAVQEFKQQTQQLAGVAREYGQIARELEIATASLGRLLTARENLQLESARQTSPWEMISKLDDRNINPKISRMMLLVLGVLASFIVGVGAALLAEQFDRVFHTVEELKDTNLPCLGVIPFNPELSKESSLINVSRESLDSVPSLNNRNSRMSSHQAMFLEAFYSLDANLRMLSSDEPIRSVTISSTSPADGKSTIAAHLAWAAVAMGRRVLLIDTDLRRPQVHQWYGIPNMRGLSTAITSDIDVMDLVQESPQDSNLFLLPAGPTPPAPGRLLSSKKMQRMMEQLTKQFDLVICDAPPILAFADAKLTAAYTDGFLLTVGLGKTDRSGFAQTLTEIRNTAHSPILGIVANGLKRYTIGYYQYYQRYYNQPTPRSLMSMGKRAVSRR